MKVYEFSPGGRPKRGRFKEYSILATDDATMNYLAPHGEGFNGVPFGRKWRIPDFYIEKPLVPKPNFFRVCLAMACDEEARELSGEALEMSGEFLPIRVKGEEGLFWIYNITNTINAVDHEKSVWQKLGPGPNDRFLKEPAFIPTRLGEETIFKIREDRGARMYCVEFTGDPDDGEFKAVVEYHGLTGLEFELVWTDQA
ncbi:hypothetical protein SDC9_138428 [bioreactor metagenome]|uniref:Uncharacterized protein n=1 Tax=bioreactor metagenome TaxID=1076179 RepID=A0A645DP92_9ZZZZ